MNSGKRKRLLFATVVAAAGAGLACPEPAPPPDVLARLDGEALSFRAFEDFLERNTTIAVAGLSSDTLSALFDQCLEERLLARLAQDELGLDPTEGIRAKVEALLAANEIGIDDKQIFRHYQRHRSDYQRPERVLLRQLLITDRATAHTVQEFWAGGADYVAVLQRFAETPSVHVGEEGEFSRQALPADFTDMLFSMTNEEVSGVLEADYGFHVFQVVRRMPAEVAPLSVVAGEIRIELEEQDRRRVVQRLVGEARERYNVRVFESNVPFNYVGNYGSNEVQSSP